MKWYETMCIFITTILMITGQWNSRKILRQYTWEKNVIEFKQRLCRIISLGFHFRRKIKPDKHGRTHACYLCNQVWKPKRKKIK